ncbi:hypothetical protein B0H19DRAFT_1175492, partial [Mycena capillaripes]
MTVQHWHCYVVEPQAHRAHSGLVGRGEIEKYHDLVHGLCRKKVHLETAGVEEYKRTLEGV